VGAFQAVDEEGGSKSESLDDLFDAALNGLKRGLATKSEIKGPENVSSDVDGASTEATEHMVVAEDSLNEELNAEMNEEVNGEMNEEMIEAMLPAHEVLIGSIGSIGSNPVSLSQKYRTDSLLGNPPTRPESERQESQEGEFHDQGDAK
jgi:hypothetical protein